jgi:hypothetical protein
LTLIIFCSPKYIFVAENKGRTIHLLKERSKPVPQERKRRKIDIMGTFEQYSQGKEERKGEEAEADVEMSQRQSIHSQLPDKSGGKMLIDNNQPNIIGNVEDQSVMHRVSPPPD